MPDTLPNIEIPKDSTVDLFNAVGVIPNGKRLRVVNIGSSEIRLYSGQDTPTVNDGYVVLKPYSAAETQVMMLVPMQRLYHLMES